MWPNKRAAPRTRYNRIGRHIHFHIPLLYPSKTLQFVKFGFFFSAFAVRVLSSIAIEENVSHCNYNDLFQKLFLFFRPPFRCNHCSRVEHFFPYLQTMAQKQNKYTISFCRSSKNVFVILHTCIYKTDKVNCNGFISSPCPPARPPVHPRRRVIIMRFIRPDRFFFFSNLLRVNLAAVRDDD